MSAENLVASGITHFKERVFRYAPLLILALFWEASTRLGLISEHALPALSKVLAAWLRLAAGGDLLIHGANSLYRTFSGLALAIVVGSVVGVLMGWSRRFDVV